MNCHNCQRPLQEGFRFCPYCGVEQNKKSFCPSCGNEVKPGWKACPNCGSALGVSHNTNNNFYPKHGRHYGSSSLKRHNRKGFLGKLFSS